MTQQFALSTDSSNDVHNISITWLKYWYMIG